jgi:peptidoglycan pentaglycine glycine transferase (the first glycine)
MQSIIQTQSTAWNAFVRAHPRAHALQLSTWGTLKSAFGWSAARVALQEDGTIIGGAQILLRPLPLRLGTMAYLPMGPLALSHADTTLLWQAIDQTAKAHGARFLKWEPGIFTANPPDFRALGFRPSPQTIQPPGTILIDLTADTDAILARMNQGTRRKIRQGDKKGVRFYEGTTADVADFNRIINTTGNRNDFGVHDSAYYEKAFELFAPTDEVKLFMAAHEDDILAGIMVFAVGDGAWYLYGASSSVKRNLMATYGVQWQAIQWAKAKGCTYYDLWGIPDADEATLEAEFKERSDGLWGVYGFKRGFGGDIVRSVGAWDKVYNSLVYTAYQTALKLRR